MAHLHHYIIIFMIKIHIILLQFQIIMNKFFQRDQIYTSHQVKVLKIIQYQIIIKSKNIIVMNTFLKYFARSSRGTHRYLIQQLHDMGIATKFQQSINSYQFRANYYQLFDVIFHCRTIESLKLQIGHKFYARDEKQMIANLKRLPLQNFISTKRLQQQRFPSIRIRSQNSFLSNNDIKQALQKHLSLMPIIKEYRRIQKLGVDSSLKNVQRVINQKKQLIFQNKQQSKQYKKLVHSNQENASRDLIKKYEGDHDQIIDVDIQNNFCRIYTNVNTQPMYKHGWKKRVGWAPIRQSIAASILLRSGIIQQAKKSKRLRLWDPFCGSGTFLFEALSMFVEKPIRQQYRQNFIFHEWPSFNCNLIQDYIKQKKESLQKNNFDVEILGSDISIKAINYSIENFRKLDIKLKNAQNKSNFININPTNQIFAASDNQVYFIAEDFQKVGEQILKKDEKFTIITNLPYGLRSKQVIPQNQLKSIYRRFSNFIKINQHRFQNVFILINIQKGYQQDHFLKNDSDIFWNLLEIFDSGGIEVGLYSLKQCIQIIKIKQPTALTIKKQQSHQLQISKPPKSHIQELIGNIKLPKYLVPAKPKNKNQLVRWRRKIHQLKIQYQRHLKNRQYHMVMQHFLKQKMIRRLIKRGKQWKAKNLRLLSGKLQNYEDDISILFQKKISDAIQRQQEHKNKKEQKKMKNKNKKTIKHKW